jgi:hypothetical protein
MNCLNAQISFTSLIGGRASSIVPDQLRPEEHSGDGEEPYQPDLEAEIWSGTPDYGQKAPTTKTRGLYTSAATPPILSDQQSYRRRGGAAPTQHEALAGERGGKRVGGGNERVTKPMIQDQEGLL